MALTMATVLFVAGLIINKGQEVVRLFVTGFLMVVIANVPQGIAALPIFKFNSLKVFLLLLQLN